MSSPVDTRTKERLHVPFARDPLEFYSTPDGSRTGSDSDGDKAVTGKCKFERIDDAIEARIKNPTFAFNGNVALTKQASDLMYKGKKVGFNLPSLLKLAKFYQTNKKPRAALHYYRRAFRHIVAVNGKFDRNRVPPLEHRRELEGIAKELRAIDPYYAGQVYQFLLTKRDERYSPGTAGLRNFRWKGPRAYSVSRDNHRSLLNESMSVPKRLKYARLWAEAAKASGDIIGMREPLGILKDSGIKDAIGKKESAWLTRMSAFDGGKLKDIKSKDLISIVQSYWNAGLVDHARAAYKYLISVEETRTPDGKPVDWKNPNLLPNLEKPLETARTLVKDRLNAVQRELLAGKLSTAETIELSQEQKALKATLKLAKRVGDETADGLFTYADAGELCKTVQTRLLMGVLSGNAEVYEDAQRDVQFMLKAAQSNRRVFMYRALHLANLHPEMAKAVRLGDVGAIFASYGSGTKGSMHSDFPHEKNINELPIVKVFAALKKQDPEKAARLQKSLNALFSHELTLARDKNSNRVTVTDMGKLRLLHANQESRSASSRIDWKLLGEFFKNVQGRTLRTDGAKTTVRVKGIADAFGTIDKIEFVLRNPALLKRGRGFYKNLDRIAYQLSKLHKKHSPGRHVDIIKHIGVSRPYAYLTAYVGIVRKALNQEMFRVMKPEIIAIGKLKGVSTKKLFEKLHAAERAPSAEKTKLYKVLLAEVNRVRTNGVIDTLVADLKRFKGADKRVENEEYWLYRQMNNAGRLAAGRTKNQYSDCRFGPLISQLTSIKSKLANPATRAAAQQEFAILMRGASLHRARVGGMKALKSDRSVAFWNTLFTELGKTLAAIVVSQGIGLVARAGSLVGLMRMGVSAKRANLISKMIGFGAGVAGFSETDMLLHGQKHDFSLGYKNGRVVIGKTYALYAQHATMFAMLGGAVKGYMWRLRQKGIKFAELGFLGKAKHTTAILGAEYGALTVHEGMWHGKVKLLCLNRATVLLMFKASGFIIKPFVKPFMKAAEGIGRRYQEHVVRMYKEMPQLAEDANRVSPDLSPREQKAVLRRQKKALKRYKRYMEAMEATGLPDYSLVTKLIGEIDTHIGRIDAQAKLFNPKSRARVQDASNIAPNTFTYVRGNRGRNGNYRNQEALARELEKHPDVKRAQEKHPQMKVRAHADGRVTAPVMDPASGEVTVMVFLSRTRLARSRKGVGQRVRDFARMVVELPKRYRLVQRLGSGLGGVGIGKKGSGKVKAEATPKGQVNGVLVRGAAASGVVGAPRRSAPAGTRVREMGSLAALSVFAPDLIGRIAEVSPELAAVVMIGGTLLGALGMVTQGRGAAKLSIIPEAEGANGPFSKGSKGTIKLSDGRDATYEVGEMDTASRTQKVKITVQGSLDGAVKAEISRVLFGKMKTVVSLEVTEKPVAAPPPTAQPKVRAKVTSRLEMSVVGTPAAGAKPLLVRKPRETAEVTERHGNLEFTVFKDGEVFGLKVRAVEGELVRNGKKFKNGETKRVKEGDTVLIDGTIYARTNGAMRPITVGTKTDKVLMVEKRNENGSIEMVPAAGAESYIIQNADGNLTKVGRITDSHVVASKLNVEQQALTIIEANGIDVAPRVVGRPAPNELIMTKLPGRTLNLLSRAELKEIPEQAWEGLKRNIDRLQELGISHGDVHEGNIIYDAKAQKLRLLDFDRARVGVRSKQDMADFGVVRAAVKMGTPWIRVKRITIYRQDTVTVAPVSFAAPASAAGKVAGPKKTPATKPAPQSDEIPTRPVVPQSGRVETQTRMPAVEIPRPSADEMFMKWWEHSIFVNHHARGALRREIIEDMTHIDVAKHPELKELRDSARDFILTLEDCNRNLQFYDRHHKTQDPAMAEQRYNILYRDIESQMGNLQRSLAYKKAVALHDSWRTTFEPAKERVDQIKLIGREMGEGVSVKSRYRISEQLIDHYDSGFANIKPNEVLQMIVDVKSPEQAQSFMARMAERGLMFTEDVPHISRESGGRVVARELKVLLQSGEGASFRGETITVKIRVDAKAASRDTMPPEPVTELVYDRPEAEGGPVKLTLKTELDWPFHTFKYVDSDGRIVAELQVQGKHILHSSTAKGFQHLKLNTRLKVLATKGQNEITAVITNDALMSTLLKDWHATKGLPEVDRLQIMTDALRVNKSFVNGRKLLGYTIHEVVSVERMETRDIKGKVKLSWKIVVRSSKDEMDGPFTESELPAFFQD